MSVSLPVSHGGGFFAVKGKAVCFVLFFHDGWVTYVATSVEEDKVLHLCGVEALEMFGVR